MTVTGFIFGQFQLKIEGFARKNTCINLQNIEGKIGKR